MKQAAGNVASGRTLKPALKGKSVLTFRRSVTVEIFSLIFTGAFTACGALILSPVLPFYVMDHGATALEFTLISSAYSFCQMVSAPLLGVLSDRIGRRPVLLGGIFASTLLYFALAETRTVIGLLVVRAALGFAGGTEPAEIAYISDLTSREERPAWISLQMRIEAVGSLAGPAIGAVIAPFGFKWICRVMGAICAFNLLMGLIFFTEPNQLRFRAIQAEQLEDDEENADEPSQVREMFRHFGHRVTGPLLVAGFLDAFSLAISDGPEPYFLNEKFFFNEPDLGAFLMLCSAAVLLVASVAPRVLSRLPAKSVCVAGSVLAALIMPLMLVCKHPWTPYIYAVCISCTSSVVEIVSKTTLLSKMVPETQRGAIYGLESALLNAGFSLGAPLGGALFDLTDRGVPYGVSSFCFLCSALAYSLLPQCAQPLAGGEALLRRQPTRAMTSANRAYEHLANEVPLPNKRFATRLQANQARRVFFVDDDLYEAFQEDLSKKMKKSHSIGVESMQTAMKNAQQMRPDMDDFALARGCSMDL